MNKNNFSLIIVDDAVSGKTTVDAALAENGYDDIRVTADAQQTLAALQERHADIVLANWKTPGLDGLELVDKIRQQDATLNRYTSIILFNADDEVEPLAKAFEKGVDDYLTNQSEPRELASRVYSAGRISTLQNDLFKASAELSKNNIELRALSHTDPITGLGNRRYFQDHLEASLEETSHRGGATCCAIIDIDHFKKMNTTHGLPVGNEVLVDFAKRLRKSIRPTDILARIDEDEFGLIMHYPDPEKLKHVIFKRIQTSISSESAQTSAGGIPVTASMGVCSRSKNDVPMPADMVMKCADQKLNKAKSKDGNQVIY